ncbi:MAG TPA: hypothetical protein VGK73_13520 [Polyangiaceae bacterium]
MTTHRLSPTSTLVLRVSIFAAALTGLAGCPVGADLEDPEKFGSGGSAPTAGTGPAAGTGGTAPTAGTAGSAGAAVAPTIPNVTCDWVTAMNKNCAISSCHGKLFQYGDLLLTPTVVDGMGRDFIARLKDVTVALADVDCDPGPEYLECTTPPAECQPFVGTKLVDSANPANSFILKKMEAVVCGNQMPLDPGSSPNNGWGQERIDCITEMVNRIAEMP